MLEGMKEKHPEFPPRFESYYLLYSIVTLLVYDRREPVCKTVCYDEFRLLLLLSFFSDVIVLLGRMYLLASLSR